MEATMVERGIRLILEGQGRNIKCLHFQGLGQIWISLNIKEIDDVIKHDPIYAF